MVTNTKQSQRFKDTELLTVSLENRWCGGLICSQVVLPCQHALCGECLVNYVESLVNQGKVAAEQVACPLPECQHPVPSNVLQAHLEGHDGETLVMLNHFCTWGRSWCSWGYEWVPLQ